MLVLGLAAGLMACASNNPLKVYVDKQQADYSSGVQDYATRAARYDEPHATLRIYPYVSSFGHGRFDPQPMNIKQINEVIINPKDTLSQVYELKMPFEKINVPVGEQTIIAGIYRNQHIKFTMNFVEGKDYIIKPEVMMAGLAEWRVYEYEHDKRFANNAKEGIILGQAVTPILFADYYWKQ